MVHNKAEGLSVPDLRQNQFLRQTLNNYGSQIGNSVALVAVRIARSIRFPHNGPIGLG